MKNGQNTDIKTSKTYAELEQKNSNLSQKIDRLKSEVQYLKDEYKKLQKMIFGAKSERFKEEPKEQLKLDLLPEIVEKQDEETKEITYTRKKKAEKKQPVRTALPAHLERKTEIVEPKELPENAKKIGEIITEVLEYTPAKIYVRRIVRPKYVAKNQQKQSELDSDNVILTASLPSDLPLFASNVGAGFLTHILVSKFIDHLPLYRQIQIAKRQNIILASSTVSGWVANASRLLEPLYDVLIKKVLLSSYIQGDESPIQVLTKDKPGSSHKGWMWVYHSPPNGLLFFDYQKGRDKVGVGKMLENYSGILQTDGYSAYNQFKSKENVRLAACMAHARRKFFEAKDENPVVCNFVLSQIRKLYDNERTIRENDFSNEQILSKRQEKSAPIMKSLKTYFDEQLSQLLPKSSTGKAVAYTLNLWERLNVFLENPEVLIDNNLIENSIRPLALGRKNYLFAGSHNAAQNIAMMYSFFGSCKMQNIEPFEWLKSTLEKISDHKANKLHELLPGYKKD
ncbi:MAG: IS66 family transposase [Patescibacteria group bacterium]|nr:IS66 family transposase [Patescibacteria group bacterium]